jgi:hypothetical protein
MSTEGFQPLEELDFGASVRGFHAGQKLMERYVLKRILGRGGMGVVWLVYDEALEREIAFKFLPEMVSHDRGALDDLKRETRRSLELTHPNIVRIYDFVHTEGCAGISMEFIDGDTLSNLRAERPSRTFEVSDLKPWLKQLCAALHYAHVEAKLAHRDLKPANLMLSKRGQLKIADFGISRSVSDTMTRVNFHQGASGTLVYMSPQQALGDRPSIADDIYSLGATIFELLTSKPPFYQGEIMLQVREKSAPTMAERRKELSVEGEPIPRTWEETIAACLSKDPAQRPKSAQEVLDRLELEAPKTEIHLPPLSVTPATGSSAAEPNPAEPRPRVELVLDESGIHGTEKREPIPRTEIVRKGKALVAIVVLLLLSLCAAWFVVWQAGITRQQDAASAKARDDAARKAAEEKEQDRLAQEKAATAKTSAAKLAADKAAAEKAAADKAAKEEAERRAEREAAAKKAEETRLAMLREQERLQNLRGTVQIETVPPGATVVLDGGTPRPSPFNQGGLRLGEHRVEISAPGYETTNLTAAIVEDKVKNAGSLASLKVTLARKIGSAFLDSRPQGAEITLKGPDGRTRSHKTPAPFENLPVGTYQATLRYAGTSQPWETNVTVEITANERSTATFPLPFGWLLLTGQPDGVSVVRDNVELGKTPLPPLELPPGKVEYLLKKPGYLPKSVSGVVAVQRTNRLQYALEAIKGPQKGDRWLNSLGMRFVPVGDGNVLFCIWETRVKDFAVFAKNNPYNVGTTWENPGFRQELNSPVVNVNWADANAFCRWLTVYERNEGRLEKQRYRLPTDREWSQVVGLSAEGGNLPADRDGKSVGVYPWGTAWPPPGVPGNYDANISYDAYDITAPVGSFRANRLGIFDLGGNVWEWCDDWYDASRKTRVLRGGSWGTSTVNFLNASYRRSLPETDRSADGGFRIVLEVSPP